MASASATVREESVGCNARRRAGAALLGGACLSAAFFGAGRAAARDVHGSTAGFFTPAPEWALGAQLGNYAGTGISLQKVGFFGGAIDAALGLQDGSIGLGVDYVRFLGNGWRPVALANSDGYKKLRGQLTPFFGGGLQVADGFSLRVPVGLAYTMLRDPFTYFGGLALAVGPFFSTGTIGPQLWFNIGARVLL